MKKWLPLFFSAVALLSFTISASAENCAACHRQVPDNSVYCTWCGTNLAEAKEKTSIAENGSNEYLQNTQNVVFEEQTASVQILDYNDFSITYTGCDLSAGTALAFRFSVRNDGLNEIKYSNYYFCVGEYMLDPSSSHSLIPHAQEEYKLFLDLKELSLLSPEEDIIKIGFELTDSDDNVVYRSKPVELVIAGLSKVSSPLYATEVPAITSKELDISILGMGTTNYTSSIYFTINNRNDYPLWMMKSSDESCLVNNIPSFISMSAIIPKGKFVYEILILNAKINPNGENTVVLPSIDLDSFHYQAVFEKTECIDAVKKAGSLQIVFNADGTVKSVS